MYKCDQSLYLPFCLVSQACRKIRLGAYRLSSSHNELIALIKTGIDKNYGGHVKERMRCHFEIILVYK